MLCASVLVSRVFWFTSLPCDQTDDKDPKDAGATATPKEASDARARAERLIASLRLEGAELDFDTKSYFLSALQVTHTAEHTTPS